MSEARRHPSFSVIVMSWLPGHICVRIEPLPEGGAGVGSRLATVRRFARSRWRACRAFMRAVLASPPTVRTVAVSVFILVLWLGVNWTYHAYSKPTEILFPLAHSLDKRPAETWNEYGSLFREHATAVITPELLAALAQVEGGGNPVARTYWRWQRTWNPLAVYQPASSAVGMYQITDATFHEGEALLHPRSRGGRGWSLARRDIVLVQQPLRSRRAEPCHRVDSGPARSRRRERDRTPANRRCYAPARSRIWPP